MLSPASGLSAVVRLINFPEDFTTNRLMAFRYVHLIGGIIWLGLLYFFNFIGFGFFGDLDAATRSKVFPPLMSRAMLWFRWAAVAAVMAGLGYWGEIVGSDAHNGGGSAGAVMGSFFLIWTLAWGLMYALLLPGKGLLNRGAVVAILYAAIVIAAAWLFLSLNQHGWESNRLLAIGIGGGIGWVMLLNVWGVIWRIQKRMIVWTREAAANGSAMPEKSKPMTRMAFLVSRANAFLSLPMLFCMAAASHYPMFGR